MFSLSLSFFYSLLEGRGEWTFFFFFPSLLSAATVLLFFFQGRAHGNKNFQPVFIVEQRHIYLSIYIYIYIYIYKEDQSASFLIHFSLLFMLLSLSLLHASGRSSPLLLLNRFFCVCVSLTLFFFFTVAVSQLRGASVRCPFTISIE